MRRLVVPLTLLALAAPFAATASVRAPGDGTLSVRDLDGQITVRVWSRGGVIGRCDYCNLFLDERVNAVEEIDPVVTGTRGVDLDEDGAKERFVGSDLHWKVSGAPFRMVLKRGTDVDLSVVGKGNVTIQGTNGTIVLNGQDRILTVGASIAFKLHPAPVTGP